MTDPTTDPVCEARTSSERPFPNRPCDVPAKHLVQMDGRPSVKVCGRHVQAYKSEIALGWRGTITPITPQAQADKMRIELIKMRTDLDG